MILLCGYTATVLSANKISISCFDLFEMSFEVKNLQTNKIKTAFNSSATTQPKSFIPLKALSDAGEEVLAVGVGGDYADVVGVLQQDGVQLPVRTDGDFHSGGFLV